MQNNFHSIFIHNNVFATRSVLRFFKKVFVRFLIAENETVTYEWPYNIPSKLIRFSKKSFFNCQDFYQLFQEIFVSFLILSKLTEFVGIEKNVCFSQIINTSQKNCDNQAAIVFQS